MAAPGGRQPRGDETRPNTLTEGNPVPNVLRGTIHAGSTGRGEMEPLQRRRLTRRVGRASEGGPPAPARREAAEPARRSPRPGCGCGGWAVLLGLLFLVMRLVGSCDEAATVAPDSPPPARLTVYWHDLEPGDCFSWPEGQEISDVTVVDCAEPHDVEVAGTVELTEPPGTAYDEGAVRGMATVRCYDVYSAYTGQRALASTGSDPQVVYPTRDGWSNGGRTAVCLAVGEGEGALIGSVRADGQ